MSAYARTPLEGYRRGDGLRAADKAWKTRRLVSLTKSALKRVNPCPGQRLSLDEATIMRAGFKRPTAVGAPSKPIKRGVKLHALVGYEAGVAVDFNTHDGSVTSFMGSSFLEESLDCASIDSCEPLREVHAGAPLSEVASQREKPLQAPQSSE